MGDNPTTILGQEKAALEQDLPYLKKAIQSLREAQNELKKEGEELANLEKLLQGARKTIEVIGEESLVMMGDMSRTDDNTRKFIHDFLVFKKQQQIINDISDGIIEQLKKEAEIEGKKRPLLSVVLEHSDLLHKKMFLLELALFGESINYRVDDTGRDAQKYFEKLKAKHPVLKQR